LNGICKGGLAFGWVALLLFPASCSPEIPSWDFEILDWPGRDGPPVSLDGPLRVEFNLPLLGPIRQGSVRILGPGGRQVSGLEFQVSGRFLSLIPRLPRNQDLKDGSLLPGAVYRIELAGIPRLAALRSGGGAALAGTRSLPFQVAASTDPELFSGAGTRPGPLRLRLASGGATPLLPGPDGNWRIPLSGPVDPRTLAFTALLEIPGKRRPQEVGLALERNQLDGSLLLLTEGPKKGWAILELPVGLQGTQGGNLIQAERRIRLRFSSSGTGSGLLPQ